MITPRAYQDEAAQAFCARTAQGLRRQLIVLPTGTGKTIVFASLISRHQHLRALVLAHREELIHQAVDKLYLVDAALDVGVVKAERNEASAQVVVASVQTVSRKDRLAQLGGFGLIIVDEAHHANADTYRYVLSHLGVWFDDGPLLLGVTATPERSDYTSLSEVFQTITYQKSILEMVEAGYLCDLRAQQVYVDISLDGTDGGQRRQDYGESALGARMLQANAPDEIARAYVEYAAGRKGLCFAPNVETSKQIAERMGHLGIRAAHLDHHVPSDTRQAILADLRAGDLDIVCNCGLLTEGFDEPSIDVIICARPTKFRGLYQQMVGRGTRLHPGKSECLILDVVGNTSRHDLQTLDRLYDLKPRQSMLEALEAREQEAAIDQAPQDEAEPQGQGHEGLLVAKDVDIFKGARAAWNQSSAGNWFINLGREAGTLILRQPGQAGWEVRHMANQGRQQSRLVAEGVPLDYAYGIARDYMRGVPSWLIDQDASWRKQGVSERQQRMLNELGQAVPATKGEAFDRITSCFVDTHLQAFNWRDAPATPKQRWRLQQLGCEIAAGLTKGEANDLLDAVLNP